MDYRRFLGKTEELVAPYLGGPFVDTTTRRLRVRAAREPGSYRIRVTGRHAELLEPAEFDCSGLKKKDGVWVRGYLALADGSFRRLELCPTEEPAVFSPLTGRVYNEQVLLFGEVLFETGVEEDVRRALEEGAHIADLKGVSSAMRSAFAFALLHDVAQEQGVAVSPYEVRRLALGIANQGRPRALEVVADLLERRLREAARRQELRSEEAVARQVEAIRAHGQANAARYQSESVEDRAERALQSVGAQLRSIRRLSEDMLEVRFGFMGERFITAVRADTLGVVDAGICLDGADREVTLESLPSVIREAIENDVLVITRRG